MMCVVCGVWYVYMAGMWCVYGVYFVCMVGLCGVGRVWYTWLSCKVS